MWYNKESVWLIGFSLGENGVGVRNIRGPKRRQYFVYSKNNIPNWKGVVWTVAGRGIHLSNGGGLKTRNRWHHSSYNDIIWFSSRVDDKFPKLKPWCYTSYLISAILRVQAAEYHVKSFCFHNPWKKMQTEVTGPILLDKKLTNKHWET